MTHSESVYKANTFAQPGAAIAAEIPTKSFVYQRKSKQSMISRQVFRSNANLSIGILSVVLWSGFAALPGYHLITGTPWTGTNRNGTISRPATDGELLFILAIGVGFALLGLWLILTWKNAVVEVDADGIVARNTLGSEVFRAEWSAIDKVGTHTGGKGGVIFDLYSGENKMSFPGMITKRPELIKIIRTQATHADFSSWAGY